MEPLLFLVHRVPVPPNKGDRFVPAICCNGSRSAIASISPRSWTTR
jgi:hypothetical protein